MDGRRFDALTRQLVRTTSRRRAVGTIALVAAGALRPGRAPAAAQAGSCAGKRSGQSCGECGACMVLPASGAVECVALSFMCRRGSKPADDACVYCDRDTFTCRQPRECGPCETCFSTGGTGCTYVPKGRDGQCKETNPCDPATGKCRCASDLLFCDPDCVDVQTDPRHCGRCDHPCRPCENCREGTCVPCDEECERCDEQRGCISTCEDQCKACLNGECVKPDPPICVCGIEDEAGPPTAKRISLPVVAAVGADIGAVEPCGEGDKAQCCVPEQCCGEGADAECCGEGFACLLGWYGFEQRPMCCPPERACGEGPNAECCDRGIQCLLYEDRHLVCCQPVHVYGDVCLSW